MTRREEITKKALELDTTNDIATFVVAAQWADKTMIDKACQWLIKYFVLDHEGMSPSGYGVFEYMFRKAMEE